MEVSQRPERWMETLLAITEHDDAEVELRGENLLTSIGGPLNFDMGEFDLEHCKERSVLTIAKNRYIALLASLRIEFLYNEIAETNSEAKTFLKEQAVLRKRWPQELNLIEKEVL